MKTIVIFEVLFVLEVTSVLGVPPELTAAFGLPPSKSSLSQLQHTAVNLKPAIPFKLDYRKNKLDLQKKNGMSSVEKSS